MEIQAPNQLDRVHARIREAGQHGVIAEDVARDLNIRASSATARIRELVQAGLVADLGWRGRTTSGRKAVRWVDTREAARQQDAGPAIASIAATVLRGAPA